MAPLDTCGMSYLPPSYYEPFIAASTRWSLLLGAIRLFYCTVVECELTIASSLMCDTVGSLTTAGVMKFLGPHGNGDPGSL